MVCSATGWKSLQPNWENCNSIRWVSMFEISARMVNQGKNCVGSKGQRKTRWRVKLQTYYMPASDVEAIYRDIYRGIGGQFMNILKERVYCQRNRRAVEKNSRGTKDQLLIDKMTLKNCRRRKTGLGMVWVIWYLTCLLNAWLLTAWTCLVPLTRVTG